MAHNPQKVQELVTQIESLDPEDRQELLHLVLTPEEELDLLINELQRKVRPVVDRRALSRDVNKAVREVRSMRAARLTS